MFETDYQFNGVTRVGLWFNQPNQAGCFLLFLLFFLVGVRICLSKKLKAGYLWPFHVADIILLYFIALTYSRGTLVALMLTSLLLVVFWSLKLKQQKDWSRYKRDLVVALGKTLVFVLILAYSGNFERIQSGINHSDVSVANRMEIARGGIMMISDNFWRGVGFASSGDIYTNWYSPVQSNYQVATLISGALTLVAEHGALALLLLIFLHVCLIYFAFIFTLFSDFTGFPIFEGVGFMSLAAFSMLVCNWFSCIYMSSLLSALFTMVFFVSALCVVKVAGIQHRIHIHAMGIISICGIFLVLFYYSFSRFGIRQEAMFKHGVILIKSPASQKSGNEIYGMFFPDREIFGYYYGKTVREIARELPDVTWICQKSSTSLPEKSANGNVAIKVFVGRQCVRPRDESYENVKIVILSPIGFSENACKTFDVLVLPELDVSAGAYQQWNKRADECGATVRLIKNAGFYLGRYADEIAEAISHDQFQQKSM